MTFTSWISPPGAFVSLLVTRKGRFISTMRPARMRKKGKSMSEESLASPQRLLSAQLTPLQEENGTGKSTSEDQVASRMGLKERKAFNRALRSRGIADRDLPMPIRDVVVKKSKKGKVGQISVRALTGVQNNSAAQLARKLENELSRGKEDIQEKLEASGNTSQTMARLIEVLQNKPQFSLARAIAEAGADVAVVLDSYAKGALALKKMETVLKLYEQMPDLMRDLARHAIDREEDCEVCLAAGKVPQKAGGKNLTQICPRCKGSGKAWSTSEHKAFAVQKMLDMSEMLPKKTPMAINVNQGVQVNASGAGDLLARLSKSADEILYHRSTSSGNLLPGDVLDVEGEGEDLG